MRIEVEERGEVTVVSPEDRLDLLGYLDLEETFSELLREGRMHNYLRMLWGKKILEWTRHPEEALAVMVDLINRYALDGRDPNSTSGIFWVLGRYDRAWGPERPIFGKIRYMSSKNTRRKLRLKQYLKRFGPDETHTP